MLFGLLPPAALSEASAPPRVLLQKVLQITARERLPKKNRRRVFGDKTKEKNRGKAFIRPGATIGNGRRSFIVSRPKNALPPVASPRQGKEKETGREREGDGEGKKKAKWERVLPFREKLPENP